MTRPLTLSILLAATLALGSCSSDEPGIVTPQEICFSGLDGNASRAGTSAEVTDPPLDQSYKMWVTAIHHIDNNGYYYFHDREFSYDTRDEVWRGSRTIYYPLNGKLDVVSFAAKTFAHRPEITYTPALTTTGIADNTRFGELQFDYTPSSKQLNGLDDVLISGPVYDLPCGKDARHDVKLKFMHLLCNVRFTFTARTLEAQTFLRVTGLQLDNIYLTGTATMAPGTERPWDISWSNLQSQQNLRLPTYATPPYQNSAPLPYVDFFLPSQATGDIVYHVYYAIDTGGEEESVKGEMAIPYNQIPKPAVWYPGMRYTYNVNITMLPHLAFRVDLEVDEGQLLDSWINEPEITL